MTECSQSQSHGFIFENRVRVAYGLQPNQNDTHIHDISKEELGTNENVSIKLTGSDTIYMGDILRVFNYDFENETHTIIVGKYSQITPEIKQIQKIYKINFTKSLHNYLFGNITFEELQKYDQLVKKIPHGPVSEIQKNIYKQQKKELITKYNMKLVINPKVDSKQQRRVQCSITNFPTLLKDYITICEKNQVNNQLINCEIQSTKRKRNMEYTKQDLIEICQKNKIHCKGYSKMNKQQIKNLLVSLNLLKSIN